MRKKYQDKTMFFLEGNFRVDRLCEELSFNTPHNAIQIHSASLPRFVLKDLDSKEYASADLHTFVKIKYQKQMEKQLLEDHTELETTKFNPEVNWTASLWPIHDKKNVNDDHLLKFQYKLKNNT